LLIKRSIISEVPITTPQSYRRIDRETRQRSIIAAAISSPTVGGFLEVEHEGSFEHPLLSFDWIPFIGHCIPSTRAAMHSAQHMIMILGNVR